MQKAQEIAGQWSDKITKMFTNITTIGTTLFLVIAGPNALGNEEINNAADEIFKTHKGIKEITIQDQQNDTQTYVYDGEEGGEQDTTKTGIQVNEKQMEGVKSCWNTTISSLNAGDTAYITVPGPNDSVTITQALGRVTEPMWVSPSNIPTSGNSITITAQEQGVWKLVNQAPPLPYLKAYVKVSFDIFTGISENNEITINIFPNPTTDIVNITGVDENSEIDIFDITGRKIIHSKDKKIDLSSYEPGTYIIHITTEDGTVTKKKIVKQ